MKKSLLSVLLIGLLLFVASCSDSNYEGETNNQITSELMAPCKQVWQRYGTIATEQLAAYAEELKEYYKS